MAGGSFPRQSKDAQTAGASDRSALAPAANPHSGFAEMCAGPRGLLYAGAVIIAAWCVWLAISLCQQPLPRAVPGQKDYYADRKTYILLEPFIGMDFHHNYGAVKLWRQGGDPYDHLAGDPANETYVYPPLTLVAFSWADLFPGGPELVMTGMNGKTTHFRTSVTAIVLWVFSIAAIFAYAAFVSWQQRFRFGLESLPLPFLVGATLASYPALFELERGNCNVIVLLAIIATLFLVRRPPSRGTDLWIGLCAAVAIGVKPYAIVMLPGLVILWRFRAAIYGVFWLALQAVWLSPDVNRWMAVAKVQNGTTTNIYLDWSHSLIAHWQLIWRDLGLSALGGLPAQLCVGALLVLVSAFVSWPLFWRRGATQLAWPFLLWLTGVGTMLLPLAYDYNLFFVPLAVLSIWRRHDPWWVHAIVGLVALWTQPFYLGIGNLPWLLVKSGSLLLVGLVLLRRIREEPVSVSISS